MEIFNKIRVYSCLFLALVLFVQQSDAQESNTYWQVDYAKGSILRHKNILGRLYTNRPDFISVGWHKSAKNNSDWKARYNYPDWGLVLMNQQFHNKNLGHTTALNYTTTYYLRNRNAKNQVNAQLGFGGGYNTEPMDFDTNLLNVAMTSHFLFTQHFKINYVRPELFDKFGLHAGLSFSHFSNGSFKKPNLGINTFLLNVGLSYFDRKTNPVYQRKIEGEKPTKQPIHFNVGIHGGFHESKPGVGLKPVYYINAYAHKKLGYRSKIQFGVDFFDSQSVKDYAAFWLHAYPDESENNKPADHRQLGVYFGHELLFNKISLETQAGYYFYKPFKESAPVYQKLAFKHYLNNEKSAISVSMKIHYFEAEFICLGYHHQIF